MVCSSVCADRHVMVRVPSDCCASSTFALGFLVRALGAADGGVDEMRSGVEVASGLQRGVRQAARAALQLELQSVRPKHDKTVTLLRP